MRRVINIFHPQWNLQAFNEVIQLMIKYRYLIFEMTKREISDQYAGQILGVYWAICHPLFMMGLFVFIFNFVFRARIGGSLDMPLDYTAYILSGLVPWLGFQQVMSRSSTSFTNDANLVKQVVFPLMVLPAKTVFGGMISQIVSLIALTTYVLVTNGKLHITYLLLPFLFLIQVFAMLGVAFLLGTVGTYIKDIKDFVTVISSWGVYLAPIVYLPAWVPEIVRPVLYLNPLSYMIWCYQDILYFGRIEHPASWVVFISSSIFIFIVGYRLFRRLSPNLAEVV